MVLWREGRERIVDWNEKQFHGNVRILANALATGRVPRTWKMNCDRFKEQEAKQRNRWNWRHLRNQDPDASPLSQYSKSE